MLANQAMFDIEGDIPNNKEQAAWTFIGKLKKSEFALKHAIDQTDWIAPGYILDGLKWLATGDASVLDTGIVVAADAAVPKKIGDQDD
jgi:hypothetical protein